MSNYQIARNLALAVIFGAALGAGYGLAQAWRRIATEGHDHGEGE